MFPGFRKPGSLETWKLGKPPTTYISKFKHSFLVSKFVGNNFLKTQ